MSPAVTVTDLALQRPGFRLGPLSLHVPAGGRVAIVGPSGSGKTTLLRCLAGLERIGAGGIRIGDAVVADARTHVDPDRRGLGFVFQDGALWPHLTVLQHLTFAAPRLSRTDAMVLLERAGLAGAAAKKPAQLSGGEAQRVGLLRALAPSPALLLLDEPLRSVDVHQRDSLVLLVRTLADERNLTTILVTHDRDEALALANELVVVHDGKIVEQGPAARLLQQPATAFTAAFLAAAACLPVVVRGATATTPFGAMPVPPAAGDDLRLVLLPGDLRAAPAASASVAMRVLAVMPADGGWRVRGELAGQLVTATCEAPVAVGATVALTLARAPRLLPWRTASIARAS